MELQAALSDVILPALQADMADGEIIELLVSRDPDGSTRLILSVGNETFVDKVVQTAAVPRGTIRMS